MVKTGEKVLYKPISNYFLERGFFVISDCQKQGIVGTSEFGVKIEHKGNYETVDILAIKWRQNGQVHSVAVECKLHGTARESVGASLNQVTDYQLFFDEVYAGTEKGQLEDKDSVLRELGVGHISVDLKSNEVEISFPAQFRHAERYNATQNRLQVIPRVVLLLLFRDIFGLPLRYMDASRGGLWVAKDIIGNIQYYAGGSDKVKQTFFGVNVEFIDDLRRIVRYVDKARLASCLKALGDKHTVTLSIEELRIGRLASVPINSPANSVDVIDLLKKIEEEVSVQKGKKRKSKPHLTVSCLLYRWDEQLTRQDYEARVKDAVRRLTPLIQVFKECY